MAAERIQKLIAQAGITSRRKAEAYILAGRVTVNGETVDTLGAKADPSTDTILVDGRPLRLHKTNMYVLLWKPTRVVTTLSDELGRRTVVDLVTGTGRRLFPVGRLDYDAEGVLLLTDDGSLAAQLAHPRTQVPKVYRAKVKGHPSDEALKALTAGIELEDGPAIALKAKRASRPGDDANWVELTVAEGRNHMVKRMLAHVGHPVIRLRRIRFANLDLEGLKPGKWRHLRRDDLRMLRAAVNKGAKRS
ncbi:MAG: pseudouridine synthase [Bradymonadia bacterium]